MANIQNSDVLARKMGAQLGVLPFVEIDLSGGLGAHIDLRMETGARHNQRLNVRRKVGHVHCEFCGSTVSRYNYVALVRQWIHVIDSH
jgi:hypothetical protein